MQNNVKTPAATNTPAKAATKATAKATGKAKRKPVAKPDAAQAAKAQADAQAAITSRGLARDASTVQAGATNFHQYSDRDTAYLSFFGGVMRANGGKATLAQIHAAGKPVPGKPARTTNPRYTGSAKATDAGAINRLIKAGYITASGDGNTLTATKAATTSAAYNGKA